MIHPSVYASAAAQDDHAAQVIAYAAEAAKDSRGEYHSHTRHQLFHLVSGSVTVETALGSFVVPPERALWMPSGMLHATTYLQPSSLRFLYFRPEAVADAPATPSVIRISPLLRELILAYMAFPRDPVVTDGPAARLAAVIIDQIATEPVSPLHLPMPTSDRLRRAVADLAADPATAVPLPDVARRAALSQRSFERHFRAETGLSYRAWLRQARLMKAVEWLSFGLSVGDIAHRLGYEGASAFVASFRKAFGVTPGRYFADAG
ncbi:helix-turn-helix domain-containing protein [Thalassobaculum sp.]|uniref:AraC family transcriptional regulator n=1 Tax=Thalassobaculum sp. TaxID=2022740 RepID=UPI003B5B7A7E